MPRTILIVDDDAQNRGVLRQILQPEYRVAEAESGQEALGLFQREPLGFSAVLLAVGSPHGNGLQALQALGESGLLSRVPVVACVADDGTEGQEQAFALGVSDSVAKPYQPALVRHCVRNAILRRQGAIAAAQRDRLTGLYSREAFFEKAQGMIQAREPGHYMLSCFDIDHFKVVNDQYGLAAGDSILRHAAKVVNDYVSSIGGICSRVTGDNFAVLYPALQENIEYMTHMQHVRLAPDGSQTTFTYSVGRYIVTDLSLSVQAMYDRALIAKQSVKGRYDAHVACFDESMREKLLGDQQIVSDMNAALEQRQFQVWFQPQFNHATGALIGAEALVRWQHPKRGLIPPGRFIPVFEENGFIYELDKYVWEQACGFLRKWIDEGRSPLPVSVNVSRYDVSRAEMTDEIIRLTAKYRISPELLRLEITESAFAQSSQQVIHVVKLLTERGFLLEIDDFGSGYSSLNILKDVPVNVLKLDMRFFENSAHSQRGGSILESVVRMAKWLDMAVIAEGVETREQADFLKSVGCNYIQGFLYARPMPAEEYEALAGGAGKEERLLRLKTVANLDHNAFWDPNSIDTLIFNSYLGGACVFEYHQGRIELLRANDKYAQVIGSTGMTVENALKLDWFQHLNEPNRAAFLAALERSITTGEEVTEELLFQNLPGCPAKTHLRSSMRVIASFDGRYLVYCTNENITEQKQAERNLWETDDQLHFLNDTAHDLLAQADCDKGIRDVLRKLLDYFGGNRAYVFELNPEKRVFHNTYQVCAKSVTPEKESLPTLAFDQCAFLLHAFDQQFHIHIEDVDALEDSKPEKRMLQARGIRSLVAVPLHRDGVMIGYIGIDDPRRQQAGLERLNALGDYIAVMITRRDLNAKILNDHQALLELMNDTPGGFMRLRVNADGTQMPVYINNGFCKLMGMSQEALRAIYTKNIMAGVHPEDAAAVRDTLRKMLDCGEARSREFRLLHGKGGYIWVMVFGRKTVNQLGETFLNIYYSDVSEQFRLEEERRDLLDNMPCGAALYKLEGDRLTTVHLNRRYRELVNWEEADLLDASMLASVHPDDRDVMMAELRLAIREKRDADCVLRILCGQEKYQPFHVNGRIVPKGNGQYAIYACYTCASQETAYQQMLPVALAAVMGSTAEISFVKDRELRYICCSHAFALAGGLADEKDIVGKTDFDLMEPALAEQYRKVDRDILQSGEARLNYDEVLPSADGSVRYATTSKYPLRDAAGNMIGLYGVGRDVTEIRTAFQRLTVLTNNIPGGIASMEISSTGVRLVYYNEGFYSFSGYSQEEYAAQVALEPLFLLFREDMPAVRAAVAAVRGGAPTVDCVYRCHTREGGYRWFTLKGTVSARFGDTAILNVVQLDVTERKQAEERLRMSEEQFRIAAALGDRIVARYDIRTGVYYNDSELLLLQGFGREIPNVPQAFLDAGAVDESTAADFLELYRQLKSGAESATATALLRMPDGSFRWFRMDATVLFGADRKPSEAIVVFFDVTEQREKETVYKKWQQSLGEKPLDSYTLFRCNLSKGASFDSMEGSLLQIHFGAEAATFNMRTLEYVEKFVYRDDRQRYLDNMNLDKLLADYYRGRRSFALEYREIVSDDSVRWLKLSVEMVEYPDSTDVEAYLMYENIDQYKRAELQTRELAETDPLTGVLNRNAFAQRMNQVIGERKPNTLCALLMFDIDGFKLVNDSFGHAMGDQALVDVAAALRSILRQGDLVGRLGGDEFLICLRDVPSRAVIVKKAKQICRLVRKSFSIEVQISASLGVALCPDDGAAFETLYHKADMALYHVKAHGKDNHAFFREGMKEEAPNPEGAAEPARPATAMSNEPKRRMLIVEDDKVNREMLMRLFRDQFIIDTASDGNAALIRLRRYGAGLSVVLLDLVMPGMDGFAVLEKMRGSAEMQTIPVVVVSGTDERETSLKAIQSGASDFVTKPVNPALIRLRVQSAISKAENQRLRAQNSYLALQSDEVARYRAVLESEGTVMAEYDRRSEAFTYDPSMAHEMAGRYDSRPLWDILQSDHVAEPETIATIRQLAEDLADDPSRTTASVEATLRTPSGAWRSFTVRAIQRAEEETPADRLILTFTARQA